MQGFLSLIPALTIALVLRPSSGLPSSQPDPDAATNQTTLAAPAGSFEARVKAGLGRIGIELGIPLTTLDLWQVEIKIPNSATTNADISPSDFKSYTVVASDWHNPSKLWITTAPNGGDWSQPVEFKEYDTPREAFSWSFRPRYFLTLQQAWEHALPTQPPHRPRDWVLIELQKEVGSKEPCFYFKQTDWWSDVIVGAETGKVERTYHGADGNETAVFTV